MAIAGMDDAVAFFWATGALGGDSMNRTFSTAETSGIVVAPATTPQWISSMIEQALRWVGVRTQLDPTSDAKRRSHEPQLDERR